MARTNIRRAVFALAFVVAPALTGAAYARAAADNAQAADVPFGVGERAVYQVKLGSFTVGEGLLESPRLDTIRGHTAYLLKFNLKGGIPFARVDDRFQSWLDVKTLASRRFDQNQKEVNYKRHRILDFYPEEKRFERRDKDESGDLPTNLPLDDVSFMFFVRTIPLEVGKTYTYNRYFKADGNPVQVKVVRRETIKVPAGTFRTIVLQPIIKTDGLFSEGGKAELYFSDDARRALVLLRTDIPTFPGTLTMHLKSYTPGRSLRAQSASADNRTS